jgi:uncharacterized lipoprotein YmbA
MKTIRYIGWTLCLLTVSIAACRGTTPPVTFYTLNAVIEAPATAQVAAADQDLAIGVGPMAIPETIDRPQIVTRSGPNRLRVDEFHRWAGSLREDFLRVLSANLSILLKTNRVTTHPWEDYFQPTYRIVLDVHQFDGSPGQQVTLQVTWTITGQDGRNALLVRKSNIAQPVSAKDYDAFVAAKSRILASFSREIATEIKVLQSKTGGNQ